MISRGYDKLTNFLAFSSCLLSYFYYLIWRNSGIASSNEQLLIVDTEALVNKIWFEEKYNSTNNTINLLWEKQNFDIYFLCYPDIDWEFSDFRENPNNRLQLFEKYESYLISCLLF